MSRLLIIGLVIIEYIGEHPTKFRGAVHKKKYLQIQKGDKVIVSEVTAITYCRGTQWKRVESDVDISTLLETTPMSEIYDKQNNEMDLVDNSTPRADYSLPTIEELKILTEKEIKALCKRFSIKIGKKKREDLIPLIIPYIQQNQIP